MAPSEVYNAAQRIVGASELAIKNTVINQSIIAEGGRDFSWVWMIVFIIFVWPAAIIYYFVAKKNTISLTIAAKQDGGCIVNVQSIGKKAELVLQALSGEIQ